MEAFGAGRKDIGGSKFAKFQGDLNKTYRVGIIARDFDSPFKGSPTHYAKGAKQSFMCKSTKDRQAVCCSASYDGNNPKYKILAAIAVYQQNAEGEIVGVDVLPWLFNEQMYKKLDALNVDTPWSEWDLELTCTDKGFQSFNVAPKKGSIWQKNEKLKAICLEKHDQIMRNPKSFFPRDLSEAEIREILGLTPGGSAGASDLNLADLTGDN